MMSLDLCGDLSSSSNQIVRQFTFKVLCTLLLVIGKDKVNALEVDQQKHFLHALQLSVDNIRVTVNTQLNRIVPEVLD